jgi:hypothetical protein
MRPSQGLGSWSSPRLMGTREQAVAFLTQLDPARADGVEGVVVHPDLHLTQPRKSR